MLINLFSVDVRGRYIYIYIHMFFRVLLILVKGFRRHLNIKQVDCNVVYRKRGLVWMVSWATTTAVVDILMSELDT